MWTNWHPQVKTQNWDSMVSPSDWTFSPCARLKEHQGVTAHSSGREGSATPWPCMAAPSQGGCVSWGKGGAYALEFVSLGIGFENLVFSARLDRPREVKLLFGPPSSTHSCVCPCIRLSSHVSVLTQKPSHSFSRHVLSMTYGRTGSHLTGGETESAVGCSNSLTHGVI